MNQTAGLLETVLPMEWCEGFMWIYRVDQDEATIELYKHGITRRHLNLDQDHKAYGFNGANYIQIPSRSSKILAGTTTELCLEVPSVSGSPIERNIVINSRHPMFNRLVPIEKVGPVCDPRIWG